MSKYIDTTEELIDAIVDGLKAHRFEVFTPDEYSAESYDLAYRAAVSCLKTQPCDNSDKRIPKTPVFALLLQYGPGIVLTLQHSTWIKGGTENNWAYFDTSANMKHYFQLPMIEDEFCELEEEFCEFSKLTIDTVNTTLELMLQTFFSRCTTINA